MRMHKISGILLAGLLGVNLAACSKATDEPAAEQKLGAQSVVSVTGVEYRDFAPVVDANGTLVAEKYTKLSAISGGRLDKLKVDVGAAVKMGDLLFEVRPVDYELQYNQARAAHMQAAVVYKDAKREKARIENLFRAGSATEQNRDQVTAASEQAEAAVEQAEAVMNTARQALLDCSIRAPYDGVITDKFVQAGEFVAPGTPVLEIMNLDTLNAELELPEKYAGQVVDGLAVDLTASSGVKVVGRIVAVNPKISQANRTFLVKVAVDNAERRLQAGLYCTARISLPEKKQQLAIPAAAVTREGGRSTVWVITDAVAHEVQVDENGTYGEWVWITAGLKGDEQIVTSGAGALLNGSKVAVSTN